MSLYDKFTILFLSAVFCSPMIIVSVALTGCPKPLPPVWTDGGDAAVLGDAPSLGCHVRCDHLRALGCSGGATTPHAATCEEVCAVMTGAGALTGPIMQCEVQATSCDAIDACQ